MRLPWICAPRPCPRPPRARRSRRARRGHAAPLRGLGALAALMLGACAAEGPPARCTSSAECGPAERCVDGRCEAALVDGGGQDGGADAGPLECPDPYVPCGRECVDVRRDARHCGACDALCAAPSSCRLGVCTPPCVATDPSDEVCDGMDNDCDGTVDLPGCGAGLLAWYRFEETEGLVLDSSGQGRHGEAMGGVTRGAAGRVGGAASFDGGAGSVVRVPDDPGTTFGTALTAEAWISPLDCAHGASGHNTVLAKETELLLAFTPTCTIANYVHTGAWVPDSPPRTVSTLSWTHYAMTYDGALVRSFVNGRPAGAGTAQSGPVLDTDYPLWIGGRVDCCEQTFRGRIDELRLWSVVRTDEELCEAAGATWSAATGSCT